MKNQFVTARFKLRALSSTRYSRPSFHESAKDFFQVKSFSIFRAWAHNERGRAQLSRNCWGPTLIGRNCGKFMATLNGDCLL